MIPSIFEYLPDYASDLLKEAGVTVEAKQPKEEGAAKTPPKKVESPASIAAKGSLMFGAGVGVGLGGGILTQKLYERATGKQFPLYGHLAIPAATAVGLGSRYAYNQYKSRELERMQNAYKAQRDGGKGGSTG